MAGRITRKKALRVEESSLNAVYKQFEALKAVRKSNEVRAEQLEQERINIEDKIRKLREKRVEIVHAASDVQTVLDRTNMTITTLRTQLDRDPTFKKREGH